MPSKKMPPSVAGPEARRTDPGPGKTVATSPTENEQTARKDARTRRISVFRMKPHRLQPPNRHSLANVLDLAGSIRELGSMLEPPLVRRTIDGRYVILAGHRRCYAWRHLVAEGLVDPEIAVYVLDGISDHDELKFLAAEYFHRKDYSVVHTAMIVGEAHRALCAGRGEEVPLRELEAVLPLGRTSLGHYLTIHNALEDTRLAPLVHSVDKPSKSLLYKALSQKEFPARVRALEAMRPKAKELHKAGRNPASDGRPSGAVKHRKRGRGFELTVKVGVKTPPAEVVRVRHALTRALADLDALHGGASEAKNATGSS